MAFRAQGLKDIVQECMVAYLAPREHMVNVFGCLYLALA
jgi:hypothetical protein